MIPMSQSNVGLVPRQTTNGVCWLDGANTNSENITQSSNSVSLVRDGYGRGNNATQSTSANQPEIFEQTQGGKNVLSFTNASAEFMSLPTFIPNLTNGSATLILVGKSNESAPSGNRFFFGTNFGSRFYIIQNGTTGTLSAFFSGSNLQLTSSVNASNAFIAVMTYDGATDAATFQVNQEATLSGTVAYVAAPTIINIGANETGAFNLDGFIGESIFFDKVLPADEILKQKRYLSNKWGIAI